MAEYKDLFKNFKTENWRNLSHDERLETLQNVENQMALEQNRSSRTIKTEIMSDDFECGYYSEDEPNFLTINDVHLEDKLIDEGINYDVLDTIIHEGRHALQDDVVQGKVSFDDKTKTELWKKNYAEFMYIDSSEFGHYRFQPIEADANDYAKEKMEEVHNAVGPDKGYDLYVSNRDYSDQLARDEVVAKFGKNYEQEIIKDLEERYKLEHGKTIELKPSETKEEKPKIQINDTPNNKKNVAKIRHERLSLDERIKKLDKNYQTKDSNLNKTKTKKTKTRISLDERLKSLKNDTTNKSHSEKNISRDR